MCCYGPVGEGDKLNERPVSYYAIEHNIKHTVLNNAIRDFLKGKPWGLKARKVPMTPVYIVEQSDFDCWYTRYQQNRQKRKVKTNAEFQSSP